jgi:hypothetical protein
MRATGAGQTENTMKRLLAVGAATLALAGCGGSKVSVSSRIGAASPLALTAATGSNQLNVNGGVVIKDVTIIVRRIRLEPTVAPAGQSSEGEDEVGFGPFALTFDVSAIDTGTLIRDFTAGDVAAGTYKEIKFEIHKVEDADVPKDPSDPSHAVLNAMRGLSVVVHGLDAAGTEFFFKSALDEEQEREGTFTIDGTNNITLNIDPINWFIDGNGATLAPGDAANKSKIESNIKASIDVYEDDDHDGKPDAS